MTPVIERTPSREPTVRVQGIEMNLRTRAVHNRGQAVHLTPTEFRLLRAFMLNANRVVPTVSLERLLGDSEMNDPGKVRFYISKLRRKLGDNHRTLIRSMHNAGYRLSGRTVPRDAEARSAFRAG